MLYNNLRREWRKCLGKITNDEMTIQLLKEQVQTRRDAIFALEQKHEICVKFTSVLESKLFKTQRTSLDN